MPTFNGSLNVNHIQSALFNMIIAQDIIGGSIKNNYNLVEKAKNEAGLYGDTKLFIDAPNLTPVDWVQDSEDAVNLLALNRPGAPKTQALVINVFKQVRLTKDDYLSKQAFGTEGAFVAYQSVLDSRISKAKEVYLNKTYNSFIGSCAANVNTGVDLDADSNSAGLNIAYGIANLIDDMKDYNTKYTKNGFERAFGEDDIKIVWNNKYQNMVRKIDASVVFHNEAMLNTLVGDTLPSRYFGDVLVAYNADTAPNGVKTYAAATAYSAGDKIYNSGNVYLVTADIAAGDNSAITDVAKTQLEVRAVKDKVVTVSETTYYVAAGSTLPAGSTIGSSATTFLYGEIYAVNPNIICKVFTKLPPVLEAFSVGTSFFNAKNLSTNLYLTFGHSTLETLDSEAIVTVTAE